MCDKPLRELSNPGASGSLFWLSHDDAFIVKTVQKGEAKFLRKLLPGYYLNLMQNKRTLLPKFFGHFCYQNATGRNIRFIVMNNLLPSHLTYYERYDLKGSTFGRFASSKELQKRSPTLKDLDFNRLHEVRPEEGERGECGAHVGRGTSFRASIFRPLSSHVCRSCNARAPHWYRWGYA